MDTKLMALQNHSAFHKLEVMIEFKMGCKFLCVNSPIRRKIPICYEITSYDKVFYRILRWVARECGLGARASTAPTRAPTRPLTGREAKAAIIIERSESSQ